MLRVWHTHVTTKHDHTEETKMPFEPAYNPTHLEGQRVLAELNNRRALYAIGREIQADWGIGKVYFGAVPYLNAMFSLGNIDESYGADSGKSVVVYFLANAGTWRGETARRIKAELRAML